MAKKTELRFPKATVKDFDVIVKPVITEKTMAFTKYQNKVVVSLNEKDKLGSLVLISCVDDALSKGLTEQVAVEE